MKFIGSDVIKINKGFFGVRKCDSCGKIKSVNLLILKGVFRFCFLPIKTLVTKKFLYCEKCNACYEITDDQWKYYSTYIHNRLDEKTTHDVINSLEKINGALEKSGVKINIQDQLYYDSLDDILDGLTKKYGHPENLQEILSVYFSASKDK